MTKSLSLIAVLSFVLVSSLTSAAPATKEAPNDLYGDGTSVAVMNFAIEAINADADPDEISFRYHAVGSSYAQRQMEGGGTITGEATCTPNGGGTSNDGCQQIAPMSRQLNSGICDDDSDNFGPSTIGESDLAEGLAICEDRLVLTVANSDSCDGDLGSTWQNKVRLLYTGCLSETGFACSAVPRTTRCARPERQALIASWDELVSGCAEGTCPTGLRAAYRRDDYSSVVDTFLGYLG